MTGQYCKKGMFFQCPSKALKELKSRRDEIMIATENVYDTIPLPPVGGRGQGIGAGLDVRLNDQE